MWSITLAPEATITELAAILSTMNSGSVAVHYIAGTWVIMPFGPYTMKPTILEIARAMSAPLPLLPSLVHKYGW